MIVRSGVLGLSMNLNPQAVALQVAQRRADAIRITTAAYPNPDKNLVKWRATPERTVGRELRLANWPADHPQCKAWPLVCDTAWEYERANDAWLSCMADRYAQGLDLKPCAHKPIFIWDFNYDTSWWLAEHRRLECIKAVGKDRAALCGLQPPKRPTKSLWDRTGGKVTGAIVTGGRIVGTTAAAGGKATYQSVENVVEKGYDIATHPYATFEDLVKFAYNFPSHPIGSIVKIGEAVVEYTPTGIVLKLSFDALVYPIRQLLRDLKSQRALRVAFDRRGMVGATTPNAAEKEQARIDVVNKVKGEVKPFGWMLAYLAGGSATEIFGSSGKPPAALGELATGAASAASVPTLTLMTNSLIAAAAAATVAGTIAWAPKGLKDLKAQAIKAGKSTGIISKGGAPTSTDPTASVSEPTPAATLSPEMQQLLWEESISGAALPVSSGLKLAAGTAGLGLLLGIWFASRD